MTVLDRISSTLAIVAITIALVGAVEPAAARMQAPGNYVTSGKVQRFPRPGPIVGAGLPVFAIGYGVYWLAKRRRRRAV
jgi:hypothetical protein